MLSAYTTTFSLIEWLSVMGFCQSVIILVYMFFRVHDWRQASVAISYFFVLAVTFALQFAMRLEDFTEGIEFFLWFSRALGPPLCYLLVLQVVRHVDLPDSRHFWVMALVPLALLVSIFARDIGDVCEGQVRLCPRFFEWLYWLGSMTGGLSMLALWAQRDVFGQLWSAKAGRERYWLVLTLVVTNVAGTGVFFLRAVEKISDVDADALLVTLGIGMAYLATTTLFRVYPAPVQLNAVARLAPSDLSDEEKQLADQVKKLMEVDKLYQEPSFSRADLARELKTSESTLSRVINTAFGKSFPRLLSEFRVGDAKRMLADPGIPIQVIAFEAGFNSLASFNRVFREITGETPSSFREKIAE